MKGTFHPSGRWKGFPGIAPDAYNSRRAWTAMSRTSSGSPVRLGTHCACSREFIAPKLQCVDRGEPLGPQNVSTNAQLTAWEMEPPLANSVAVPVSKCKISSTSLRQEHLVTSPSPCGDSVTPVQVTRRVMGGLLLATSATILGCDGAPSPLCGQAFARAPPLLPLPSCATRLDGQLAAALTRALYSSVLRLQVMDEADFHRETFKLREREYKYYAEANRAQLPRIPDLGDNTGGLSNATYFNFIYYCLWKVVYRHVTADQDRAVFARVAASELLSNLSKVGLIALERGGNMEVTDPSPEAMIRGVFLPFLEVLKASGYICRYQLVLGSHPGSWPQDWMLSQPVVMQASLGEEGSAGVGVSDGEFLFQLKMYRPADILGSVALRSEEGGAWPRTVSLCLMQLLEQQGYCSMSADPAAAVAPDGRQLPNTLAVGEEAESLFEGQCNAECDEFFYQDQWQGPKSFTDKLLLFFGDPLEQVTVDFIPTTLVQNWRLRYQAVPVKEQMTG